jgi:hypothetical protein
MGVACGSMVWASVPVAVNDHFPFLSAMALVRGEILGEVSPLRPHARRSLQESLN